MSNPDRDQIDPVALNMAKMIHNLDQAEGYIKEVKNDLKRQLNEYATKQIPRPNETGYDGKHFQQ